jgi:hypothetical protein
VADEAITKDFVDRAIAAERQLTDEKFKSRDKAIELLASKAPTYIALAALALGLAGFLLQLKGH